MIFKDRADAGRALAAELAPLVSPPCIVAAVPRGGLTAVADLFVSLTVDEEFRAIGEDYIDFSPVPDEQVVAMLERARELITPSARGRISAPAR